jgi:hypothetical protein
MDMSEHTPGPWKWSGRELEQEAGEYKEVIHTEVSCGSYCYGGCVDMTISDADKRLIEAAPDLLAALKLVVDTYGFDSSTDSAIWKTACAAIAKATGA